MRCPFLCPARPGNPAKVRHSRINSRVFTVPFVSINPYNKTVGTGKGDRGDLLAMEEHNNKPKEVSKLKFALTIFVTFFFRSFIFLTVPALICLILGAFRKELFIVGSVLLAIDLFITIFFTIKTVRLKGSHEMFNAILNAAHNEDAPDVSYDPYSKPDKDDLYSEKAHELRREASSAKSVRDVFWLYKKDIADMAITDETYTVYFKKEKYFFDDQMHFVISFDRMREINDDIEQHMYMDILFEPDRFDSSIEKSFESSIDGDTAAFFENVGAYLESNGLMELSVDDINVGASY